MGGGGDGVDSTLKWTWALAGVAQWGECQHVNQRVVPVPFPLRAHAWVAGWVPNWGHRRGNHTSINKSFQMDLGQDCLEGDSERLK